MDQLEHRRGGRGWSAGRAAGGAAIGGAVMALVNRNAALAAEATTPPQGDITEVEGAKVRTLSRGTGRPILLIHGNGTLIEDWVASGVFDRVAARHRTIAIDRPGFGYSDRPRDRPWTVERQAALIHGAMRMLGIQRPIIVGHSFGALVATRMAADYPDDVAGLVLAAGYYRPTPRIDAPLASLPAVPILGDILRHTLWPMLSRVAGPILQKQLFGPAPVAESFAAFPAEMANRPAQIRATAEDACVMVPGTAALVSRLPLMDLPVVVLNGDGDRVVDVDAQARALHAEIAGSELRVLPGVGHMLHYTDPDAVAEAVERVSDRSPF